VSKERAPGFVEGLFFHFPGNGKQVLSGAAKNGFLIDLKAGKAVAQFKSAGRMGLSWPLQGLHLGAGAVQHLAVLVRKLKPLKLKDGQPEKQIKRDIVFALSAVQRSNMQLGEDPLELSLFGGSNGRLRPGCSQNSSRRADRGAGFKGSIIDQGFHVAMFGDQLKDILPGQLRELRADKDVVA